MAKRKFDMPEETALLPHIVADGVLDEVEQCAPLGLSMERRRALADRLGDRAERVYAANPGFRKQMRARSGRDQLYAFMRHWASSEIRKCCPSAFRVLTPEFMAGHPLICDASMAGRRRR